MKIAIIGGGPAGLYFGLLMKKNVPDVTVDLFERNGPDDTFGWGVVFSDKTLNYLKAEDELSAQWITESFATWENVEIVHHDEKITVRGNKFSGIARIEILHILQRRAVELGVNVHFRHPVSDIGMLSGYDLIVGADGINSEVRSQVAEHFKPDLSTRTNRYIWYGTPHLFHALTLTFRENGAGVFAAHSYKFDQDRSTFIVECDEETWQAAGFQDRDETATRRYLQEVFHLDLAGAELLSNNSKWINFLLVKNRHWYHNSGNQSIVLLGDSLATVHFSIGSGTKLALEDAIALYHAIRDTTDIPRALERFELERRPVVEAYQEAAYESLQLFENLKDYMHLDAVPFAYRIMTRSKRVDLENLRKRDPEFAKRFEQYSQ